MNKKTIIVTGGSGYLGLQVVSHLSKKYNVIIIDKKNPSHSLAGVRFVKHDLLNPSGLLEIFKKGELCIHLAAEVGGVAFANQYPAKILTNNSLIDINTISLSQKAKLKKFIYISSSLVYEKCQKFPLKEEYVDDIPMPSLSYGFEKLLGENLCKAYQQEYGLNFSVCRIFNVYGKNIEGNQDPNGHVIPDLIKKVSNSNGMVEIIGKQGIARNFSHVDDVAKGIVATLECKNAVNDIFNIADKKEYTLEQIVEILWKIFQKKEPLNFKYIPSFKKDVSRNYASLSKTHKLLGWEAVKKMEEGLGEMI